MEAANLRRRPETVQGKIFEALRQLETIRAEQPVFCADVDVWVPNTGNSHVLCLCRWYQGQQLTALFNFSEEPQTVAVPAVEGTDLVTGLLVDATEIELPGYGFLWLKSGDGA